MGENGFEIIRKYMYILKIKSTYLNALLSFLLSSRLSNRSDAFLASFSFFGFPPLRRSKRASIARFLDIYRRLTLRVLDGFSIELYEKKPRDFGFAAAWFESWATGISG